MPVPAGIPYPILRPDRFTFGERMLHQRGTAVLPPAMSGRLPDDHAAEGLG